MGASLLLWSACALLGPTPEWSNDYGKALSAAKANGKPLLVVLDQPNEPKARVRQVSLSAEETATELLKPYHLCHIDVTTSYGKRVAEVFEAKEFPQTYVIRGGAIVYRKAGEFTGGEWAAMLVKQAQAPLLASPLLSTSPFNFRGRALDDCPS